MTVDERADATPVAGPRPRRKVSDDEFNRAYFGDPKDEASLTSAANNRNIIKGVAQKYQKNLSADDLHALGLKAMWRALQYHREEFGQKFTTSLHRFTEWECKREARAANGGRKKKRLKQVQLDVSQLRTERHEMFAPDPTLMIEDLEHVKSCLELLESSEERELIRQYYFEGMSLGQLGEVNGFSKETASKRLQRSVESLKRVCLETLGDADGVLAR